jgi:hypothetical protein
VHTLPFLVLCSVQAIVSCNASGLCSLLCSLEGLMFHSCILFLPEAFWSKTHHLAAGSAAPVAASLASESTERHNLLRACHNHWSGGCLLPDLKQATVVQMH